jgi:hypothetical protein
LTGLLGAATGGVVGGLVDWLKGAPGAQGAASNKPIEMTGVMTMNGDAFARFVGTTVNKSMMGAPTGPAEFDSTMGPTVNDAAYGVH